MKRNYFYLSFGVFLSACTSGEQLDSILEKNIENNLSGIVMNIPDFVFDESATRTNLVPTASSVEFSWKEGDQVGIYTESSSMANFDIDQISQDAKSATFDGGGFSLSEGSVYYAFYPYDAASTSKTSVAVDYTGQTQTANNDCSHLAAYDYMVANATATNTNVAAFDFMHLGAIAKLKISLPQDGTYTCLTISCTKDFFAKGTVDLTTSSVISTLSSNNIVLNLDNIASTNKTIIAYLIMPSIDLLGENLKCSITDDSNHCYEGHISGKKMEAGKAYGYSVSMTPSPVPVDLGLSVRWATTNIGAVNPEDNGDYYAWGETSIKDRYAWNNYAWNDQNYNSIKLIKYCCNGSYGTSDGLKALEDTDDVAMVLWGESWEMPTASQIQELVDFCSWEWTSINGINGYKITGNTGNSIFLPASGGYEYNNYGNNGYYRPKDFSNDRLYYLSFTASSIDPYYFPSGSMNDDVRYLGFPVRAVTDEECVSATSVSVDETSVSMVIGETTHLQADVLPANASNKRVKWSTNDKNVISVNQDGSITALKAGNAYVYATVAGTSLRASCRIEIKDGVFNSHEYVDLGLSSGTLWATCNIGADYYYQSGLKFAWGETTSKNAFYGYSSENCNYLFWNYWEDTMTKYNDWDTNRSPDFKTVLDDDNDAAYKNWGGIWRMPTKTEIEELLAECTVTPINSTWIGYKVTGKNGNYIYLPFESNCNYYWTSNLYDVYDAWVLFKNSQSLISHRAPRTEGAFIRPVCNL